MKKFLLVPVFVAIAMLGFSQNLQPYQLFNSKGKKVSFKKLVKEVADHEVVLFGEYHDDAIAHWMQLKLSQHLYRLDSNLVLGAEMFERDGADFLAAYLRGEITETQLIDTVPRMWQNYPTDYAPLVNFARDNNLEFIATNVPRYLASTVYRGGWEALDTLSEKEKGFLPTLPVPYDATLPGYDAMLEMGGAHASETMPMAQAIKDATMGWNIVQHLPEGGIFLHFNGAYHSNDYEGIYWYIQQYAPGTEVSTISTVRQTDLSKLEEENRGVADFILVVDEDMTRTYR